METTEPTIAVLGIGTALPRHRIDQDETARKLADALTEHPSSARWTQKIFKQVGVETRYTCEPELLEPASRCRYAPGTPLPDIPTTAERMETYRRESVPLAVEAARRALQDSGTDPSGITHLFTVSCTGMFLPGMDAALVERLGLAAETNRLPLTFLGCAAGLTAIRLAKETVQRDPSAVALIVCVELCTLHIQPSGEREALFGAAFFGDGASACVVGSAAPGQSGIFALGRARAVLFPESAADMVWNIGNYGFDLALSPQIPKLIGRFVPAEIERLLDGGPRPELWAIHPGGRAIIDTLQTIYGLTAAQMEASRSVLRHCGNMSSATILFVLQNMRQRMERLEPADLQPAEGIAAAFGPGLHAEMMRIAFLPAGLPKGERAHAANVRPAATV